MRQQGLHVGGQVVGAVYGSRQGVHHQHGRQGAAVGVLAGDAAHIVLLNLVGRPHLQPRLDLVVGVDAGGHAAVVVVVAHDDTVVVQIGQREVVAAAVTAAGKGEVVLLHLAVLEDGVHPVGVRHAVPVGLDGSHGNDRLRQVTVGIRIKGCHVVHILLRVHQFRDAGDGLRGKLEVVGNLRLSGTSFLRGDEDDTVTGLGTVDGSRCSILQHLHGLDVVGVDARDVAQAHAVHHIQRVGCHVGRVTAHADGRCFARAAGSGDELHAGRLALQGLGGGGDGAVLHVFGFHLRDGARHRAFLLHAVADDHHLVQRLGVFLQGDVQRAGHGLVLLRDVTHIREYQRGSRLHADGIVAVDVRDGAMTGALHLHTYANHGLAQIVKYLTCHFHWVLRQGERYAHQ